MEKPPAKKRHSKTAQLLQDIHRAAVATENVNVPLDRLTVLKGPRVTFRTVETTKRHVSRLRGAGKLVHFLDIPLDVFFEIASALNPIDVLQFSRVSKHFRSLLMTRNARFVWAAARGNVPNLPNLPKDLNEPQYASLLFDRTCQACGCVRAQITEYAIRLRFCVPCHKKNIQSGNSLMRNFGIELPDGVLTMIPRSLLSSASAAFPGKRPISRTNGRQNAYYSLEFKMVATRFLALKNSSNRNTLVTFVREQQELASNMMQHGYKIEKYEKALRISKEEEDLHRMLQRESSIAEMLSGLGWNQEYYPHQNSEWRAIVKQPKELTPRTWNAIRPKLIGLLEENKKQIAHQRFNIRQEEFTPIWSRFLAKLPKNERLTMPRFVDAVQFPSIKDLFTEGDGDLTVTQERWMGIATNFMKDVEEYRWRAKCQLVQIVKNGAGPCITHTAEDSDGGVEALQKALFCCNRKQCRNLIPYPDIMQHIHYFPNDDHTQDHLFPGISCPSSSRE